MRRVALVFEGWGPGAPTGLARGGLGLLMLLGAVAATAGGCIIEERPFDQQLADCNTYCDEVESNCIEPYRVYDRRETCLSVCRLMEPGDSLGGSTGNTLRCRLDKLRAPDFEAAIGCPQIGPGGDGQCGTDCEALCGLRQKVCAAIQPEQFEITNPELCELSCAGLRDEPAFNATAVAEGGGDSLQCRLVHISEAAVSTTLAQTHCVHTQVVPEIGESVPCSDPQEQPREQECSTYCGLVMTACQAEYQVYEDEAQCLNVCGVLDQGLKGETASNSLRCRRYHSYSALGNPEEHCTHAGPTGDGHCGTDNCYAYCQILKAGCPDRFTSTFNPADALDLGTCEARCIGTPAMPGVPEVPRIPGAEFDGFHRGGTRYVVPLGDEPSLQCRTFHAVRALAAPGDLVECAAAFADPDSACE